MVMRINARLDEDHSRKLAYLTEVVHASVSDVIKQAIDAYYERVRGAQSNAGGILRGAGFVGCGQASPELSDTYKQEAKLLAEQKHGYR
ncbi:MAG: CopG family transcriptional regulator [Gammaproteobacteria bacterium]